MGWSKTSVYEVLESTKKYKTGQYNFIQAVCRLFSITTYVLTIAMLVVARIFGEYCYLLNCSYIVRQLQQTQN